MLVYTSVSSVRPGGRWNKTHASAEDEFAAGVLSVWLRGFSQNTPCLNPSDSISVGLSSIYGHKEDAWLTLPVRKSVLRIVGTVSLAPKKGSPLKNKELLRDRWGRAGSLEWMWLYTFFFYVSVFFSCVGQLVHDIFSVYLSKNGKKK